jgi:hypothetical protein
MTNLSPRNTHTHEHMLAILISIVFHSFRHSCLFLTAAGAH